MTQILPFLKWAGGKRWLVAEIAEKMPAKYDRYVEPFLGGGAVFFSLCPNEAVISDANKNLIEVYNAIKCDWQKVWERLKWHQRFHSHRHYYSQRSATTSSAIFEAARFIYLNRSCFNGLYRVNLKGEFNVPKGTKDRIVFDCDDFEAISFALQKAEIRCCDFEETLSKVRGGDFVFLDPPYTVNHNMNGFIKYNEKLFSWNDQMRLRDAAVQSAEKGAHVIVTNASHDSLSTLYKGVGTHHLVGRYSVLAAKKLYRKSTSEMIINIPSVKKQTKQRNRNAEPRRVI